MAKNSVAVIVIFWVASAMLMAQPTPGPQNSGAESDYIKIEVRGRLQVIPNYKFDPRADPRKNLGAAVAANQSSGVGLAEALRYELLIEDRKHFELVASNDGKKIIVSGLLEHFLLPSEVIKNGSYPPRSPVQPERLPVKYFIRVRDVRLAATK
jgi:hypothetical protein